MAKSKLLNRLNEQVSSTWQQEDTARRAKEADYLEEYKKCKEDDAVITVRFDLATKNGDLSAIDKNGVELRLMTEALKVDAPYYRQYIRSKFIGVELTTKVLKVDEENKVVYLQSFLNGKIDNIRGAIRGELEKALKARDKAIADGKTPEPIVVFGRVLSVNEKGEIAQVDILDRGVRGRIHRNRWQSGFLRTLDNVAKVGELYQFEVTGEGFIGKNNKNRVVFYLDRANIASDPWAEMDDYHPGDVIIVKVSTIKEDQHFCWGYNERIPGLDIMLRLNPKLTITPGLSYKCKVTRFNRDSHYFLATPFELVSDVGDSVSIRKKK